MSDYEQLVVAAADTESPSFRRRMAISELSRRSEPGVARELSRLLDDPDRYLRREIVTGLARLDSPAAIPGLLKVLGDDDDTIRREAVEGLGRVGDRRSVAALRPLLEDASYSLRSAAARAVEQIEQRLADADAAPGELTGATAESAAVAPTVEPETAPSEGRAAAAEEAAAPESEAEVALAADRVMGKPAAAEPIAAEAVIAEAVSPERGVAGGELPAAEAAVLRIDWNRASRIRGFFGDAFPQIRSAYETVLQRRGEVRGHTAACGATVQQLCRTRTAEQKFLDRCTAAIEAGENEVQELTTQAARIERQRNDLNRQLHSLAYWMNTLFAQDKRREDQEQCEQWREELERLYAGKRGAAERLQESQAEYQRHLQPLVELEEQLEALQQQRDAALQQLGEAHAAVNDVVLDVLLSLPAEELDSRLERLAAAASRSPGLERVRPWLTRSVAEWRRQTAARDQADAGFQEVIERLDRSGQDLTESLGRGFQVSETRKQVPVRLEGGVEFQEERSAFRGYAGARGTAAGTGRGTASYAIEQVSWQPPDDLPERVAGFASAWQAAGSSAAQRQLTRSLAECARQAVDDWVWLIRAELESEVPELCE